MCTYSPPGATTRRTRRRRALAADLDERGVRVLYDDRRHVSAGVKFADAELLGMPTIVVLGRGLTQGLIELRDRRTGRRRDVPLAAAAADIHATVARNIPSPGPKEAETSTG
jgi:prolyl-tRNA synthetase